jgi:hypothetical protein
MATVSIPLKFRVPRYQLVSIMGARRPMALVMASIHAGNWDVPLFSCGAETDFESVANPELGNNRLFRTIFILIELSINNKPKRNEIVHEYLIGSFR